MKIATMIRLSLQRTAIAAATLAIGVMLPAAGGAQSPPPASNPSPLSPVVQYFADWFPRVTRIQSEQTHWGPPLATVTPRLDEEYLYDQLWQAQPHGKALDTFGANKGLELILSVANC